MKKKAGTNLRESIQSLLDIHAILKVGIYIHLEVLWF